MAHSNGKIYIDKSVTPNVGISIADIQAVFGSSKNDIGGLIQETDGNGNSVVNPYNRNKPIRHSALQLPTFWYRGMDNSCGLNLTRLNYNEITKANVRSATSWRPYTKVPRGLTNIEWFRFILDFDGYDHAEPCPLYAFGYPDALYANLDTPGLLFQAQSASHLSDTKITPYDLMQYFTANASAIAADTTTWGYFGLILIGTGSEGDDAVIATFSRESGVQPTIDIDMTSGSGVPQAASSAAIFAANKEVYLVPCIANINTGRRWVNVLSNNSLQVILWPSELGAYQAYTMRTYTPPALPDYYITVMFSANPWDFMPATVDAEQTVTVIIEKRSGTGSGMCPSLYIEHPRYILGSGGSIARTERLTERWLLDGGYDADDPTNRVTTLVSGMKWQFQKKITRSFFLSGSTFGSSMFRFVTDFGPYVELDGSAKYAALTSESENLTLGWPRN